MFNTNNKNSSVTENISAWESSNNVRPIIEFINVHKAFSSTCIPLNNINLKIFKGEILVVCGPSGAGKSTLLRVINKIEQIDSGEIIIEGKSLSDPDLNLTALRSEIGMVFQHFNLYPHKTVLHNITLAPRLARKLSRKKAEETAMQLLDRVGLAHKRAAYPVQLSGGEQQRVAIARSLAMAPGIMLLDEPTSALDPELITEVFDVITALAEDGMTMIIVTHEMGFAQKIAHRIAFMECGRIVETGTTTDIYSNSRNSRTREFMGSIMQV